MRAMGMKIHAINRRGRSAEPTEWISTPAQLDVLLRTADVLVIAAPLSHTTVGCIGARELALMKEDAILVNLARGEIIDDGALFDHLQKHPAFTACLDAWGASRCGTASFGCTICSWNCPNVIGSPHNSASVGGWHHVALQRAAEHCRRALTGAQPTGLIGPEERLV
jgi:glycerate dehydrogenase